MKSVLTLTAMLLLPILAQAGDNGSYYHCKSASGRTEVIYGNVGSGAADLSVELKIDKKSYGPAVIGSEVMLTVTEDGILKFNEMDLQNTAWLSLQFYPDHGAGYNGTLLGGLDPRNNKPLTIQVNLKCKTVFNEI